MKKSFKYLRNSCIIIALLIQMMVCALYAQVYTPNCTPVDCHTRYVPLNSTEIAQMNAAMASQIAYYKWTTATKLADPTYEYNCHSYA